jgi:cytochrome c oxidase assembly protein subunit 15
MPRGFSQLCLVTLVAVYILILIGGIVRTTGSGMGCPDWPKCFGSWVPPSSVDQLPENYKSVYATSREKRNAKFARYLRAFGFSETADQIVSDQSIQTETDFNVAKAWIEYGNRIVGVVIGFLIALLCWKSRAFRKAQPAIFFLSLITLITVIVQGWFGSIVVSTNLTPWTITIHMFLALLIVALLVRILFLSSDELSGFQNETMIRWILACCMMALLIQILLGTNVRAAVDAIARQLPRSAWIDALGIRFILHRSFSLIVLLFHVILLIKLSKIVGPKALPRALIMIILGALVTGVGMAALGFPAALQPLHLLLATSAFGIQLYLFFQFRPRLKSLATI